MIHKIVKATFGMIKLIETKPIQKHQRVLYGLNFQCAACKWIILKLWEDGDKTSMMTNDP